MQSSNPAFSQSFASNFDYAGARAGTMTVQGTAAKTFLLLGIAMATAMWSWSQMGSGALGQEVMIGSGILGFVIALLTCFNPKLAAWTGPVYAGVEGVFLGMVSQVLNARFPNIAIQAVALTGGVTFLMLFVYVTGLIKVTGQLASAVVAATGAICLVYLVSFAVRLAGYQFPYIHDTGPIGIAFSVFVVGLAAFNLLLDFDFIERGQAAGLSKSMEWYGAFGLMVTLVWMYLEILRLLSKLNRR